MNGLSTKSDNLMQNQKSSSAKMNGQNLQNNSKFWGDGILNNKIKYGTSIITYKNDRKWLQHAWMENMLLRIRKKKLIYLHLDKHIGLKGREYIIHIHFILEFKML